MGIDLVPGFPDALRTVNQPMQFKKVMKSFFILTLAAGLLAGCGVKENKTDTTAKPDMKTDSQPVNGEVFLVQNAKKEGVKTTASGLQYKVIQSGTGESPKLTDRVKVHYHGTLIDGTVFDSSVQRGQPISFPVGGVIPGWVESLQLMKVGDK